MYELDLNKSAQSIPVDALVLDGGTQSRAAISEITVEEYTEVLASTGDKWPFPDLDVFHDGSQYLVASGFHRVLAARRHGRDSVPCIIRNGTAWDAFLFGIEANKKNALRPTQADKRYSVEILLDSVEKLTQQKISDIVGVTRRTVNRIVAERKAKNGIMSHSEPSRIPVSGDPFDVEDPFEDEGEGEDGGTDSDGQDAHQEHPPWPPRNGKDESGGSPERTPAEEFKIQKSKTIKTAEALARAFDDLNDLCKSSAHERTIAECQALIVRANNWQK